MQSLGLDDVHVTKSNALDLIFSHPSDFGLTRIQRLCHSMISRMVSASTGDDCFERRRSYLHHIALSCDLDKGSNSGFDINKVRDEDSLHPRVGLPNH